MANLGTIDQRSARTAVIEERPQQRGIILDALRILGFNSFSPVKNLSEFADNKVESTAIDWIIVVVDSHTLLSRLDEISSFNDDFENSKCPISILYCGINKDLLPHFFAAGIISCHATNFEKNWLCQEIKNLIKKITDCRMDPQYVAATYMRELLISGDHTAELVHLEKAMDRVFKDSKVNALELADAFFRNGQIPAALRCLDSASYYNPGVKQRAKKLEQSYLKDHLDLSLTFAQRYDINHILLILERNDPDIALSESIFAKMGLIKITKIASAEESWPLIQSDPSIDLIVTAMAFKKGIQGAKLLQRLRTVRPHIPVIVISSPLQGIDAQIAKDSRVLAVINRPATPKQFLMGMAWTITQNSRPTEPKTVERLILAKLSRREFVEAFNLRRMLTQHAGVRPSRISFIDAMFCWVDGDLAGTLEALRKAYAEANNQMDIIVLLSEALFCDGDYKEAVRLATIAIANSPQNIERLCLLSRIYRERGQFDQAKSLAEQAGKIDCDHPLAVQAWAKLAYLMNDEQGFASNLNKLYDPSPLFEFVNERGVYYLEDRRPTEAIKHFLTLLPYVNKYRHKIVSMVLYNLALAYVRAEEESKARSLLSQITKDRSLDIYSKAQKLLALIDSGGGYLADNILDGNKSTMTQAHKASYLPRHLASLHGVYTVRDHRLHQCLKEIEPSSQDSNAALSTSLEDAELDDQTLFNLAIDRKVKTS